MGSPPAFRHRPKRGDSENAGSDHRAGKETHRVQREPAENYRQGRDGERDRSVHWWLKKDHGNQNEKPGRIGNKPLSLDPYLEVLREHVTGNKKASVRAYCRKKIKILTQGPPPPKLVPC